MNTELDSAVLLDGDIRFHGLVSRLRPSQLSPGDVAVSRNMRIDESGTAKLREGYKNVSGVVLTTTEQVMLVPAGAAGAVDLIGVISSCTASGTTTVTVATPSDWVGGNPGHTVLVDLTSFSGGTGTLNGNHVATWVNNRSFTVVVAGVSGSWTGGVIGGARLTGGTVAIRGACRFSDPDNSNIDYIILADNIQATAIKLSDLSKTTIAYPAGEVLSQEADLKQEFDTIILRQYGSTSWEFDPDDSVYGFGGSDGTAPIFRKLSSGDYTQPIDLVASAAIDTGGKCLMDVTTAHFLKTGDKVTVMDAGSSGLPAFPADHSEFEVVVTSANIFYIRANVKAAGSGTVKMRHRVSLGGGYIHAPAAAWGTYVQRRVAVPYTHDGLASPAARGVSDQLIFSDILDNSTFDPMSQFRITGGTADYIVGLQVYDADRLLVFNRNSIHYVTGVSGTLLDAQSIQLTDEIGCVARKSIVLHSGTALFLSDSGIYAVSFADALNLRGTEVPLSEAIEKDIKRINPAAAAGAVGIYHDNRAWFAVPTGDSLVNNEIFIYSFLNQAWESLDTVSAPNWGIVDLIRAQSGQINELYAVTEDGGIHQLDRTGLARDRIAPAVGSDADEIDTDYKIPGELVTRQYTMGTIEKKRFNHLDAHFLSDPGYVSDGCLFVIVEDPDQTISLGDLSTTAGFGPTGLGQGESGSFRTRLGNPRGYAVSVQWLPSVGRPELRAIGIRGTNTMNSSTSTQ